MEICRIVYEKGLDLRKASDGRWYFESAKTANVVQIPQAVPDQFGVRAVFITAKLLGSVKEKTFFLTANASQEILYSPTEKLMGLIDPSDFSKFFRAFNLGFVVGAVVYHFLNLAERYANVTRSYTQAGFPEGTRIVQYGSQHEPYYEFEALVTTARRAYDSARYILWKEFHTGTGSTPASFIDTLKNCKSIPASLRDRLETSWSNFGEKITDYRDCIQHYVPMGTRLPAARMEKLNGQVWSAMLLVPDNPDARSAQQFRYDKEIDALTYGWKVTNEAFTVMQELLRHVANIKKENI